MILCNDIISTMSIEFVYVCVFVFSSFRRIKIIFPPEIRRTNVTEIAMVGPGEIATVPVDLDLQNCDGMSLCCIHTLFKEFFVFKFEYYFFYVDCAMFCLIVSWVGCWI